jgi:peptide/nickel transport system substrate-binding protein
MNTRKRRRLLVAVTVGVAGLAVFAATVRAESTHRSRASADRVLRVDQADPVTSLDPNIQITRSIQRIDQEITETATKYVRVGAGNKAKYVLKPWLVTGWKQVSPTRWRFAVRPNVKFSNGEVLTANAFKVTLDTLRKNPTGLLVFFFNDFKSINVVNKMTFDVVTTRVNETIPSVMSLFYVFAPGALTKLGEAQFGQHPVGTGPYVLGSFQPSVKVTLVRNSHYWGPKPKIAQIAIRTVADESTRVSDLLSGNADLVEGVVPVSVPEIAKSSKYQVRTVVAGISFNLLFNIYHPPFNNLNLRKAVNYAIDRSAITNGLFHGYAGGLTQWYVPQLLGYEPGYKPYSYNPAKARQLIAAAGAAANTPIDFYFPIGTVPLDQQVAEVIQQQLQAVGLKVNMHGGPYASVSKQFTSGTVNGMYFLNYGVLTSEAGILFPYYFTTGSNYANDAVSPKGDAYYKKALQTASEEKRAAVYQQFQHEFLGNESLIAPLYRATDIWGAAKDLKWEPQANQRYYFEYASWK